MTQCFPDLLTFNRKNGEGKTGQMFTQSQKSRYGNTRSGTTRCGTPPSRNGRPLPEGNQRYASLNKDTPLGSSVPPPTGRSRATSIESLELSS